MASRFKSGAALCLVALSLMFCCPPSLATRELHSFREPLQVELTLPIDLQQGKNTPFEAFITEDVLYGVKLLPEGTRLYGYVRTSHESRRFARPGYAQVEIQRAILPSGESYTFEDKPLRPRNIMHPKAVTLKNITRSALPFTLVSVADAVPLKYATGMSSWIILPISLGARMTLGIALEHTKSEKRKHDEQEHSWPRRYGHGMLRGTGLTGLYHLVRRSPNPELTTGESIPLYFKKRDFATLFAASPVSTNVQEPVSLENNHAAVGSLNLQGAIVTQQAEN